VLVCLLNLHCVQLTGKGILVGCARMVCYFYAPTLAHGVVIEVDIGAFIEAMMRGILGRRGYVVMDIREACHTSVQLEATEALRRTASREIPRPAVGALC
jgi:hypothetical protein